MSKTIKLCLVMVLFLGVTFLTFDTVVAKTIGPTTYTPTDSIYPMSGRPVSNNPYAPSNLARVYKFVRDSLTFGRADSSIVDTTTYFFTKRKSTTYRYYIVPRVAVWNFKIWTAQATTDSGGIDIWFNECHSLLSIHKDTLIRKTIGSYRLGLNATGDTLSVPMRLDPNDTIFFHSVKGGTADTACLTYVEFNIQ
jgi:hypothetical protein